MPRRLLITIFAAAAMLAAVVLAVRTVEESSAAVTIDSEEAAFLTLINNYRAAQNPPLPGLQIDYDIQEAAEWMSADMGQYNYFSHTDRLGQSPWTRMCNFGYCFNTTKGENIAAGYGTAAQVFEGWRNSPGHNANMLNVNFRVMGIGRVVTSGSTYGTYWTNDFGGYVNPAGLMPPSGPTNTPVPTASPTPTAVPPTPSPTRTPSPTPTAMPVTPSPTPTAVPVTPSPTPTAVPVTASPTRTPSPTPTRSPSPTPVTCAGDVDCDGWSDFEEMYVGTNVMAPCSATWTANDESYDAVPGDMNDDRRVNSTDTNVFRGRTGARNGSPLYSMRLDLNMDDRITLADVLRLSGSFDDIC